jgi:predicted double-glycine peptidase/tetratricopeptide (TPR) repeat protein
MDRPDHAEAASDARGLRDSRIGPFYDRIDSLARALERSGFHVAAEQEADAARLLLDVAGRGELRWSSRSLRDLALLLGPVFCRTPDEQERFPAILEGWVATLSPAKGRAFAPDSLPISPDRSSDAFPWSSRLSALLLGFGRSRLLPLSLLMGCVALTALAFAFWKYRPWGPSSLGVGPVNELPPSPAVNGIEGRALQLLGFALVVGIPLATFLVARRRARRDGFELRAATMTDPLLRTLTARAGRGFERSVPFTSPAMTIAERSLSRRVPVDSEGIDVQGTISRAVERPGVLERIPARQFVSPDHLVLIDRAGPGDHRARLADVLIDRLEARGVCVQRFDFERDPRTCSPRGNPVALTTLNDLAAAAPEGQRLLVFSDGAGLIDPRNGEPEVWLSTLRRWPERVLLTPFPPSRWGYREGSLRREGVRVVPANAHGLAAFGMSVDPSAGPTPRTAPGLAPPLPGLLEDDPARWISNRDPGGRARGMILETLKADLGESGFLWLGGCAVYPTLQWELTLDLGHALRTPEDEPLFDEATLLRLIRLPWFLQGSMPEWLRSLLKSSLSPAFEQSVHDRIDALLEGKGEADSPGFGVAIAVGEGSTGGPADSRVVTRLSPRDGRDRLGVAVSREVAYLLSGAKEQPSPANRMAELRIRAQQAGAALAASSLAAPVLWWTGLFHWEHSWAFLPIQPALWLAWVGWYFGSRRWLLLGALLILPFLIPVAGTEGPDSLLGNWRSLAFSAWFAFGLVSLALSAFFGRRGIRVSPERATAEIQEALLLQSTIMLFAYLLVLIREALFGPATDINIIIMCTRLIRHSVIFLCCILLPFAFVLGQFVLGAILSYSLVSRLIFVSSEIFLSRATVAWLTISSACLQFAAAIAAYYRTRSKIGLDHATRLSVTAFIFGTITSAMCLLGYAVAQFLAEEARGTSMLIQELTNCNAIGSAVMGYCVGRSSLVRLGLFGVLGSLVLSFGLASAPSVAALGPLVWSVMAAATASFAIAAWYERTGAGPMRFERVLLAIPVAGLAIVRGFWSLALGAIGAVPGQILKAWAQPLVAVRRVYDFVLALARYPLERIRVARTPIFLQSAPEDCGAAALGIILAYYGRFVSIEELLVECNVATDGSNAFYIKEAAKKYGLTAKAYRTSVERLRQLRAPEMVFWDGNHFLVVEGFAGGKVYLNDPAKGRRAVDEATFRTHFAGIAFRYEPGPGFQKGGMRASEWKAIARQGRPRSAGGYSDVFPSQPGPLVVMILSAPADVAFGAELVAALTGLVRRGLIQIQERALHSDNQAILREPSPRAGLILPLISADFLREGLDDRSIAVSEAASPSSRVIPIIVRPCAWATTALGRFQVLPRNGRPLSDWPETGEALAQILTDLQQVVEELTRPNGRQGDGSAIAGRVVDERGRALALRESGGIAAANGRLDEAANLSRRSLEISERIGDFHVQALTLQQMGMIAMSQARYDEAVALVHRSLDIAERLGDEYVRAQSFDRLGIIAERQLRFEEAESHHRRSLTISERLGDEDGQAQALDRLGSVAERLGRLPEATDLRRRAEAIRQQK